MTIGEVSKTYDISVETLRYYERVGLIPPVNRKGSGIRNYTETDCEWVYFIKCMRTAGITIEILVEYVALFKQGSETHFKRKQILIEQRDDLARRIDEMQQMLEKLDRKIEGYEDNMYLMEEKLGRSKTFS